MSTLFPDSKHQSMACTWPEFKTRAADFFQLIGSATPQEGEMLMHGLRISFYGLKEYSDAEWDVARLLVVIASSCLEALLAHENNTAN